MSAQLIRTIQQLLDADDPELKLDELKEGENLIRESHGIKYYAHVVHGKISRLSSINSDGVEGIEMRLHPVGPIKPDHVKVCMCVNYSSGWGEGIDCWWVPSRALGD